MGKIVFFKKEAYKFIPIKNEYKTGGIQKMLQLKEFNKYIIIGAKWCKSCAKLVEDLNNKSVEYMYLDLESDEAVEILTGLDIKTIPVAFMYTDIGRIFYNNPTANDLILGLANDFKNGINLMDFERSSHF